MHSTTYRRQAKRIEATQAIKRRAKDAVKVGDHYTDEDRRVADQQDARDLFRAFLAEEICAAAPLRESLCTPMTVGEASIAASTVR